MAWLLLLQITCNLSPELVLFADKDGLYQPASHAPPLSLQCHILVPAMYSSILSKTLTYSFLSGSDCNGIFLAHFVNIIRRELLKIFMVS